MEDDTFLMGRSWILWVNPAETIGLKELAKAEAGEETNTGVEHSISGDLEEQENEGA